MMGEEMCEACGQEMVACEVCGCLGCIGTLHVVDAGEEEGGPFLYYCDICYDAMMREEHRAEKE